MINEQDRQDVITEIAMQIDMIPMNDYIARAVRLAIKRVRQNKRKFEKTEKDFNISKNFTGWSVVLFKDNKPMHIHEISQNVKEIIERVMRVKEKEVFN